MWAYYNGGSNWLDIILLHFLLLFLFFMSTDLNTNVIAVGAGISTLSSRSVPRSTSLCCASRNIRVVINVIVVAFHWRSFVLWLNVALSVVLFIRF